MNSIYIITKKLLNGKYFKDEFNLHPSLKSQNSEYISGDMSYFNFDTASIHLVKNILKFNTA